MMYFIHFIVHFTCKMKEHLCQNCNKSYASCQSLWNHKQKCKRMNRLKVGGSANPEDILEKIEKLIHSARNGTESEDHPSTLERLGIKGFKSARADSIDQSVPKIQVIDDSPKFKIFKEVILEDKKKFQELYNELQLKRDEDDFTGLDELLSTYFEKDLFAHLQTVSVKLREKIHDYLDRYTGYWDTKFLALQMSMILTLMDGKREAVRVLCNAMDLDITDREEVLGRQERRGLISDEEREEFLKDPNLSTIQRLLTARKLLDWVR